MKWFIVEVIKGYSPQNKYQVKTNKSVRKIKMSIEIFKASVFVSEQLNRQLLNAAQDLAHRCVYECAERYGFDAEEAVRNLGLAMVRLERKAPAKEKAPKQSRVEVVKPAFPLPYNGEFNDTCCYALRQNNGLYTQCTGVRKSSSNYCKSCGTTMQKTGSEVPEYGTIQQRMEVGIFEFVDPKGRKPIAYTKVMKKYKISKEQVEEEAGKLNIVINANHFEVVEEESKRGRPSSQKDKVPKEKGAKGRPKKEKKVLQIEGDDEDLFAALVAEAHDDSDVPKKKAGKSEEEKEAERLAKEQEKEAKRLAVEEAKQERALLLAAEKAEKEAKKKADEEARALKKAAEEAEKLAKKQALEQAKQEKEAKLAVEKEAKLATEKAKKQAKKVPEGKVAKAANEEEEPDVVKKIEFEGKKYLKSKKTGIIYDYNEYVQNGEQVVVGKWNDKTNKIDLDADEEEEEEYDM